MIKDVLYKRGEDKMKEMYIGGQLFPTDCPERCPEKSKPFYQGNTCSRCPISNSVPDANGFSLVDPNDYRSDWAKAFRTWFNNGMIGQVNLPLYHRQKMENMK